MLKWLLWLVGGVFAVTLVLSLLTLLKQDLPWSEPPGLGARLGVYLGHNIAQTTPDAAFRELRSVYVAITLPALLTNIQDACVRLGWKAVQVDSVNRQVRAQIVSPWLSFTDDLVVQIHAVRTDLWRLDIRSAARQGKADFGANERHILDLLATLPRQGLELRTAP